MAVEFENTAVFNIEGAMRGMTMPKKGKTDTSQDVIGENDYRIACNLVRAGFKDNAAHCKFLRQILLSVDITAPLYWWSEFDTYRIGVTADSESTMHTLLKEAQDLTVDDFDHDGFEAIFLLQIIKQIQGIADLNWLEKDKIVAVKRILPTSFLQKRHITMNYEVVRNMYKQRKNHRLSGWNNDFVNWAESLPYSEFITGKGIVDNA